MRDPRAPHALTWAWWVIAAVATVQLAPNPLYVTLVIALSALVVAAHREPGPLARAFPLLVAVATVFVGVRIVLTAVTTHTGEHVLFTLPEVTLPALLGGFAVGGTIEAGVIARAAVDGFVVVGVIAAFGAFNAVVAHHELVRSAPRAFHEVGLIVTVALVFVPSTIAAISAVREADRARTGGRVVRRGRLLRQIVPVLESGMERAMGLAESMDARGFAHGGAGPAERRAGWLAFGSLGALAAGFAALVGRARPVALGLGVLGVVLLVAAVAVASRASSRPRHRALRPSRADLLTMAGVAVAPVGAALAAAGAEPSLVWTDPVGTLPPFDPAVGVALLALALPVARRPRSVAVGGPAVEGVA